MKKTILSTLTVLALLSTNTVISTAYADTKIKIFKVNHLSKKQKLKLRAYPSSKSRIKVSLPHNAKDITETGKKRKVGRTNWRQVNWNKHQGWVKSRYLKKTGMLVKETGTTQSTTASKKAISSSSRNIIKRAKVINTPVIRPEDKPQSFGGDRYDQPVKMSATDIKVAYSERGSGEQRAYNCQGSKPQNWNITLDITNNNMRLDMPNRRSFNMPINYHEWESKNKMRMNLGGDKGRNMVDVNLEKTNSCRNDNSNKTFPFEVNATINKSFFFGCCDIAK
ncbi:MAG: hypothetical protein V3V19_01495 [Cocleimonas sp.]